MPIHAKFLKTSAPASKIDTDTHCPSCGYNVRGLNVGRACPECGEAILLDRPFVDPIAGGSMEQRERWRMGLALATVSLATVIAARLLFFIGGFAGVAQGLIAGYIAVCAVNSLIWLIAVWMITPAALDQTWPWMPQVRLLVRLTQALWLVAFVLLAVEQIGVGGGALPAVALLCRTVAGVGALVLAWVLRLIADEAELTDASRRLNAAVWLLPIVVPLTHVFPPLVPWYFLVVLGLFLLASWWVIGTFALATLELQRHVTWSIRHGAERHDRSARVTATREELEAETAAQVRAVPPAAEDIPLEPPQD